MPLRMFPIGRLGVKAEGVGVNLIFWWRYEIGTSLGKL